MSADAVMVELRLDDDVVAVRRARSFVRDTLADAGLDAVSDDATLVVSELVTNALLHARPPVVVRVTARVDGARVEVEDASPSLPVRPLAKPDAMTGRGLRFVATLATAWGVEPTEGGKLVWCDLSAESPATEAPADDVVDAFVAGMEATAARDDTERYLVALGDVPTDLLLDAKSHVDNVIREFTLASRGAATGATAPLPPRLAELVETVTGRFAEARRSIKRQALAAAAAGEERTRLQLELPLTAAAAGRQYLAALDEVDSYARAARLLTLETPPGHRAFRHWYVTCLSEQLEAIAADRTPPPVPTFERYLLDTLGAVAAARRVAERAARLQSATAALAQATTPEQVAAVVVSEGVNVLGASGGSLMVPLDNDHLAVPGAVGYAEALVEQLRAERRDAPLPAAQALRTGRAVWLESRAERDARFPALTGLEPSTLSMCALPLTVGEEVLGVLRFSFDRPRLFDEDERRFTLALAAQTAAALERARLFELERAARARTTFLAEATQLLSSSLEPADTVNHLTALLVPAFADWATIHLVDDAGVGRLIAFAHRDRDLTLAVTSRSHEAPLAMTEPGGVAEVLRTGRVVRYAQVPPELAVRAVATLGTAPTPALQPRAGLIVPLVVRSRIIGALALTRTTDSAYTEEDERTICDVAGRAAVAVLNAQQYARERQTALTLQHSLLPQRVPELPGVEFAWRYLPAGEGALIGGDWYDVLSLDDGTVALVIGDVMGRGVEAAAVMGQLRATARAYAAAHMTPGVVLGQLDAAVARLEQGQITTAAFAVLDPASRSLRVASAGHLPPLVVPADGEAEFLEVPPGPPLGAGAPDYVETQVSLDAGTLLLLYTDGLVEDRARPVDEGMQMLAKAASGARTAEQLCDQALIGLGRGDGHDDDTALLAVRLTAG